MFKYQICGGGPQLQRSDRLLLSTQHYYCKDHKYINYLGVDDRSGSTVVPVVAVIMIVAVT